tara:strand:- start:998 stop:1363 length:366 start_codon:yes stop_codon:yes gene_type:complete
MSAGTYNFTIEQGTTFTRTFWYKDSSGNPISLSGYAVRMDIKKSYGSVALATYSTTTEHFTISTPEGGSEPNQINLSISAAETSALNFTGVLYDIELINNDIVTRLLQGKIKLSPEVTTSS